jgi:hypothetical protein
MFAPSSASTSPSRTQWSTPKKKKTSQNIHNAVLRVRLTTDPIAVAPDTAARGMPRAVLAANSDGRNVLERTPASIIHREGEEPSQGHSGTPIEGTALAHLDCPKPQTNASNRCETLRLLSLLHTLAFAPFSRHARTLSAAKRIAFDTHAHTHTRTHIT